MPFSEFLLWLIQLVHIPLQKKLYSICSKMSYNTIFFTINVFIFCVSTYKIVLKVMCF